MGTHRESHRKLAALLESAGPGPWDREQLRSQGWSDGQLERALARGDIVRVRREDTGVLQLTLADFFGMVRPEAVVLASGASRLEPRLDVHVGETRSIPLRDRDVHAVSGGDGLVAAVAAVCARQGSLSPQEDSTWESVVERLELLAAR